MEEFVSIGKICRSMGISLSTAYRRIKAGTLVPAFRTSGGHRRFDTGSRIAPDQPLRVVTYAWVSSADQKNDLVVQSEKLKQYVEQRYAGAEHRHISDLGSGLNYRKKGLKQLLQLILTRQIDVLVLNHRDRLLRFGAELVFKLCQFNQVKVVIIEATMTEKSFEEELTIDVIELKRAIRPISGVSSSQSCKTCLDGCNCTQLGSRRLVAAYATKPKHSERIGNGSVLVRRIVWLGSYCLVLLLSLSHSIGDQAPSAAICLEAHGSGRTERITSGM